MEFDLMNKLDLNMCIEDTTKFIDESNIKKMFSFNVLSGISMYLYVNPHKPQCNILFNYNIVGSRVYVYNLGNIMPHIDINRFNIKFVCGTPFGVCIEVLNFK